MNSRFINQLEPPVLPVSMVKTEPLPVIKNEPCESEIDEFIDDVPHSSDIKDIDIGSMQLHEDSIKSETVPEDILETVFVKTENGPIVKIENITDSENLIKTEDTVDDNGQEVAEARETEGQHFLNFSHDLIDISIVKPEHPEEAGLVECYKTAETIVWEDIKEKIKVIEAPIIPVEPHEFTSIAKDQHVCNHCQHEYKKLNALKYHIRKVHKEITTMYQCLYCSFKSKWRPSLRLHITYKHRDTKDTHQWVQYHCDKCDYKTYRPAHLKKHQIVHLKPEETQYFYCCHCSYKSKHSYALKSHTLRHFKNAEVKQNRKRYGCDKCDYTTFERQNLKKHNLIHLKPEEIEYFYCYHCSYKSKRKETLKGHIFRHLKKVEIKQKRKRYRCDRCHFKAYKYAHMKKHEMTHLKPEEIPYFYCYHCSYKSKQKGHLKTHIFRHFKNGDVTFYCYICDFTTLKRELIINHIKKHPKVKIKSEINEGS